MKNKYLLLIITFFVTQIVNAQNVTKEETIEYLDSKIDASTRLIDSGYEWDVGYPIYRKQTIEHFGIDDKDKIYLTGGEVLYHGNNNAKNYGVFTFKFNPTDVTFSYTGSKIKIDCNSYSACISFKTTYYSCMNGNREAANDTEPLYKLQFNASSYETAKRIVKAYNHLSSFYINEDPFGD